MTRFFSNTMIEHSFSWSWSPSVLQPQQLQNQVYTGIFSLLRPFNISIFQRVSTSFWSRSSSYSIYMGECLFVLHAVPLQSHHYTLKETCFFSYWLHSSTMSCKQYFHHRQLWHSWWLSSWIAPIVTGTTRSGEIMAANGGNSLGASMQIPGLKTSTPCLLILIVSSPLSRTPFLSWMNNINISDKNSDQFCNFLNILISIVFELWDNNWLSFMVKIYN